MLAIPIHSIEKNHSLPSNRNSSANHRCTWTPKALVMARSQGPIPTPFIHIVSAEIGECEHSHSTIFKTFEIGVTFGDGVGQSE